MNEYKSQAWPFKMLTNQCIKVFFATSQTVCLFLPRLTDGAAWIYFHRERERNLYENSYHLMPRPGIELTSVERAPPCGTLIFLSGFISL